MGSPRGRRPGRRQPPALGGFRRVAPTLLNGPGMTRRLRYKTHSIVGASLGLTAFFTLALLPSVVYGGVAGVRVASGLFGEAGASGLGANAFIVLGILSAVCAIAALFAVIGAVAGASVGALTRATLGRKAQGAARFPPPIIP